MFTMPEWLGTGTHAARPAATAVAVGALYACSDHLLIYQSDGATWSTWADVSGSGGGAPSTADYLVGTTDAGLSAEIVVGTAPGGFLAGTWAAPDIRRYGCKVYRNGATQNVNNTTAVLTFDTELFDSHAFHDAGAPTRMTIPSGGDGLYLCTANTFVSGAGLSLIGFQVGGAAVVGSGKNKPDASAAYASCATILDLVATNYVEVVVTTSANVNLGHATLADAMSSFSIVRLSL